MVSFPIYMQSMPVAGDENSKGGKDKVQIDGSPKSPEELTAIKMNMVLNNDGNKSISTLAN